MTNEQAIEQAIIELRDLILDDRLALTNKENEALLLAIKALRFANDVFPHTFQQCCEDWEKENG